MNGPIARNYVFALIEIRFSSGADHANIRYEANYLFLWVPLSALILIFIVMEDKYVLGFTETKRT